MATIKSYTSLEQSKKLAEILPLESADYFWAIDSDIVITEPYITKTDSENLVPACKSIPCWSLSALLDVLPYPYLKQDRRGKWICRVDHANTAYMWEDYNLVDACVEMILKLHKLKLL